jgi:hypothetical protein
MKIDVCLILRDDCIQTACIVEYLPKTSVDNQKKSHDERRQMRRIDNGEYTTLPEKQHRINQSNNKWQVLFAE